MRRRTWYELLAAAALTVAGWAAILAVAGAALQQAVSVAAAALCAIAFFIPGIYFLGYARRLRARDLALAHAAAYVEARGTLDVLDLATELAVTRADAEKILQTVVREGRLKGRLDGRGHFVAESTGPESEEGRP